MNTIEKIHREIDLFQEMHVKAMKNTIEEVNKNANLQKLDKAKRLERIGFTSAEEVVETKAIDQVITDNQKQIELFKYFTQTYPFNKFLTVEELDNICEKYNLVYANVSEYIKTVPEKNLLEIEQSKKLCSVDTCGKTYKYKFDFFSYVPHEVRLWLNALETDMPLRNDDSFRNLCPHKYNGSYLFKSDGLTINTINKDGLFIAAPPTHFKNLNNLQKIKKGFFKFTSEQVNTDPIVFQFCRNKMIRILTKWGLEAEDEKLIVPINN